MKSWQIVFGGSVLGLGCGGASAPPPAQPSVTAGAAKTPAPAPGMNRDDEIALALSAAPPAVAAKAGVYVLDKSGYVKAKDSQNGFVCYVDHRVPAAVEPQCPDEEGAKTFLPRAILTASLRAQGKSEPEIRQGVRDAFAKGTLRAPSRPGVNYMLSTHNVVTVDEEHGVAAPFPPHLMFYAPYLTNATFGSDGDPHSPLFVVDEGTPHALVIVPVPNGEGMAGHAHAPPAGGPPKAPAKSDAKLPAPMPRDREIALALSAAPPAVAAKAGVYVLEKTGYVKARESENGFVCLVDHRVPAAVEPQCPDEEGVKSFLPRSLLTASLRAQGKSEPEIRQAVREAFGKGTLRAPARAGINYMLSTENVVTVDEEHGVAMPFPAHFMFYAPYLTNATFGSDGNPGSALFVVDEGTPHALVIVPAGPPGASHAHAAAK